MKKSDFRNFAQLMYEKKNIASRAPSHLNKIDPNRGGSIFGRILELLGIAMFKHRVLQTRIHQIVRKKCEDVSHRNGLL